ncbi:hypothetical protein CAPTEDRAFT_110047 [Capitella teleta]|uniref:Globin domain-containing protein n=1 Tax=Capitella teleta TaxID=283909 RepID=R7UKY8_CAPTE|nr:hypothetical protein CAPTEDRAFT_110047 [Capitella teleta]|eukprot:ELU04433.1 hypothetical protein CAPTEDRAFT_110047 [Capitella teleta]
MTAETSLPSNGCPFDQSVFLTDKDKLLIRRNWKHLACNLTERGARVFLRIFVDNPSVKDLFPFKKLQGEELTRDVNFRGHASRFMQAVGAVVDNIDDFEQSLAPLLNGLGRKHIDFHGFTPTHFNAFQDAMLAVWSEDLGGKLTPEGRDAWIKVFGFIMRELKKGYSQAEGERVKDDPERI